METLAEHYKRRAAHYEAAGMEAVDCGDEVLAVRMFRLCDLMIEMIELRIWEFPGHE